MNKDLLQQLNIFEGAMAPLDPPVSRSLVRFMRENGSRLTGKSANFDGFVVWRHPVIDSQQLALNVAFIKKVYTVV